MAGDRHGPRQRGMTSTGPRGLSEREVAERRARGQGNTVALPSSRSYAQILRENVFTLINTVLFGLGIALVLLGRVSDAVVSVVVVLINVLVSVVQEVRAKRTLDRIALLTRPTATVIRDGQARAIDPGELVVGDVLLVHPGDQIVVDGQVLDGRIDCDESLLTGESDLMAKQAGDPVYSGSFCVTGSAYYEAQQVGAASLAQQLTAGARAFRRVYTPLQQQVNLVIRVLLLLVVGLEGLITLGALVDDLPLVEGVKMWVVIAGLVPNGLLLAIALAYAAGAVRLAGQGVLVQQANAIESLSSVDVLCLDKTGTLTANRLRLHAVHPLGISEARLRHLVGLYAASTPSGNRTSEALAAALAGPVEPVHEAVPFSSARKWSALAVRGDEARGTYVLGAPELLAPALPPSAEIDARVREWAGRGLRVLLFAHTPDLLPLHDPAGQAQLPPGLVPLGLVSLADELRPEARETLTSFAAAGVQLKLISGDHPDTVAALARQAGLSPEARVVSGPELAGMDTAQFAQAAADTTVFGRITPQQKERLVQVLRQQGHYVAMIGDGVNDVLSLKQANLGIAMQSGSQATRAVADLLLLNDSFAALLPAVQEGQRIINGMQDIFKLFLTRIVYVAILVVATGIIGGFPFAPKHSSLLALLTVGLPTIALAAWARPGARPQRSLLRPLLHFVLPAALTIAVAGLAVYLVDLLAGAWAVLAATPGLSRQAALDAAVPAAQSALTVVSVVCGLLLIPFAEPPSEAWVGGDGLSGDRRPTYLALGLLALFGLIMAVPATREFFEFAPLGLLSYAVISLVVLSWALLLRYLWRARLLDRFLGVDLR